MGTPTTDDDINRTSFAGRSESPTVVSKRAVCRQVDLFLRAVCDEIVLRKERVGLDLVGRLKRHDPISTETEQLWRTTHRNDTGGVNDALELSYGKV